MLDTSGLWLLPTKRCRRLKAHLAHVQPRLPLKATLGLAFGTDDHRMIALEDTLVAVVAYLADACELSGEVGHLKDGVHGPTLSFTNLCLEVQMHLTFIGHRLPVAHN